MHILDNSIILDTETLSLRRGAAIHELATLDLQSGQLHEYILDPQTAVQLSPAEQDLTKMSASSKDVFVLEAHDNYKQAIQRELELKNNTQYKDWAAVQLALKSEPDQFLYEKLNAGVYPHLLDQSEDISKRQAALGPNAKLGIKTSLGDLMRPDSEFVQSLKGKTIWGMNIGFDSKMVGAQIEAMANAGQDVGFKNILETHNPDSPDPFYVTGKEVNAARLAAARTGDWTQVWKAYVTHTPKEGETAVRDIQDVTRAMFSYAKRLKLIKDGGQHGTSLDFMYRLLGSAEENAADFINTTESHRAAEDVAKHSKFVLENVVKYTEMLQAIDEGDLTQIDLAKKGQGDLFKFMKIMGNYERALPALEEKALRQRLVRAQTDIAKEGKSVQVVGISDTWNLRQVTGDGQEFILKQNKFEKHQFTDMSSVVDYLNRSYKNSGKSAAELYAEMQKTTPEVFLKAAPEVPWGGATKSAKALFGQAIEPFYSKIDAKVGIAALGVAAGIGVLGVASATSSRPSQAQQASIMVQDYRSWEHGLQAKGISAETRKHNTDFGSPYQGIVGSNQVFIDQELLKQRQEYIREQYSAESTFSDIPSFRKGYSYLRGEMGTRPELRGNYMKLSLNDYKVEVEDADTVILKRKGFMGAVEHFFGMNSGYAFRLAGLDSPEVAHGNNPAQPHAEKSKRMFEKLLKNSNNLELYIDPKDASYGRPIAALFSGEKFLNQELVRMGAAAALPYGKWEDSMVSYNAMMAAENAAAAQKRGMWGTPWAQTFRATTDPKNRPTFNSLARSERVAQNTQSMGLVSLMQQSHITGQVFDENTFANNAITPGIFEYRNYNADNFYDRHKSSYAAMNVSKGSIANKNTKEYGKLNEHMALDSMSSASNNVWQKRTSRAAEVYSAQKAIARERRAKQAAAQRYINQQFGNSAINHTRM